MKNNQLRSKALALLSVLIISSLMLASCGDSKSNELQTESKSIEQIHTEEGVPVRIMTVANTEIDKEMTFLATMSGIQETTVNSMIGDKIESVKVNVGSRVAAGQVLVTFPTDNPQLQWEQAKTALNNSKKTYDRMKNLFAAGETAQANLDGAETQYLVAKQSFESLRKMVYIDAPFSGVVTNIPVKVGDRVSNGAPLVTIAQTGTMVAKIWASEYEVRQIKQGMPATVNIDGKEYTGKVAVIGLGMNADKKAFQVDVHFNNSKGEIKSGTTCSLVMQIDKNSQSIVIPRRIIQTNADEKYVFVEENNIAKKVLVATGMEVGINVEIISGLKSNDKIIIEGMTLLDDGKKIKVVN